MVEFVMIWVVAILIGLLLAVAWTIDSRRRRNGWSREWADDIAQYYGEMGVVPENIDWDAELRSLNGG